MNSAMRQVNQPASFVVGKLDFVVDEPGGVAGKLLTQIPELFPKRPNIEHDGQIGRHEHVVPGFTGREMLASLVVLAEFPAPEIDPGRPGFHDRVRSVRAAEGPDTLCIVRAPAQDATDHRAGLLRVSEACKALVRHFEETILLVLTGHDVPPRHSAPGASPV